MARKHSPDNPDNYDPVERDDSRDDSLGDQELQFLDDAAEMAAGAPAEDTSAAVDDETVPPSEEDLESQGFTPDEVRRLVLISDRAAHSAESRAAEAEMRRLRFTRWLIEHGVLDEWSA